MKVRIKNTHIRSDTAVIPDSYGGSLRDQAGAIVQEHVIANDDACLFAATLDVRIT